MIKSLWATDRITLTKIKSKGSMLQAPKPISIKNICFKLNLELFSNSLGVWEKHSMNFCFGLKIDQWQGWNTNKSYVRILAKSPNRRFLQIQFNQFCTFKKNVAQTFKQIFLQPRQNKFTCSKAIWFYCTFVKPLFEKHIRNYCPTIATTNYLPTKLTAKS